MRIDYYLNGQAVTPVNKDRIYIEVNHDQQAIIEQGLPHVGVNNLYFAREDVQAVRSQLNQSPGITEGVPFEIRMKENGQTHVIQMYLDMLNSLQNSPDGIEATVKMLQSLDWMNDKLDGFTFESMYNETGVIPFTVFDLGIPNTYSSYKQFFDSRMVFVPYVISTVPNWNEAFLAIFGVYYIGNELYKTGKSIVQWVSPSVGLGSVVHIIQFTLEIAYFLLLIAMLLQLLTQLINSLIQPLKYHGGMLMSDLFKVTAAKIGLTARSSIWDSAPYNQLVYIPEKFAPIESPGSVFSFMASSGITGYGSKGYTQPNPSLQRGYYNGTGGNFLRLLKTYCNGKFFIPDGTSDLYCERRDYYPLSTPFQLPDLRQDWHTYNTEELSASIVLQFLVDLNEKNCIDYISGGVPFYLGTILEAVHQQDQVTNQKLVLLKGLREINVQAARGAQKERLNFVETLVGELTVLWVAIDGIYTVIIDAAILVINIIIAVIKILITIWNILIRVITVIIDTINQIISIATFGLVPDITPFDSTTGQIDSNIIDFVPFQGFTPPYAYNFNDRINALLVENDFMYIPKIVQVDTRGLPFLQNRKGFLHVDNRTTVSAVHLWDNFYNIDAFVDANGNANNRVNRFTKLTPSLNHPSDKNRFSLSLNGFKNLVSNPQLLDNYSETVVSDSVQWFIEQNGACEISYRKSGWLNKPQDPNYLIRSQEIAINMKLKISVPNGQ